MDSQSFDDFMKVDKLQIGRCIPWNLMQSQANPGNEYNIHPWINNIFLIIQECNGPSMNRDIGISTSESMDLFDAIEE